MQHYCGDCALTLSRSLARIHIVFCSTREIEKKLDWKRECMAEMLREACSKDSPSLEEIKPLICPETVKAANDNGDLALHLACGSGASLDIVEHLVLQWPDSVKQADNNGCIPLHWACFGKASIEVVHYLILRWPDGIRAISQTGNLPIHYACAEDARKNVVKHLVHKWPASLKYPTVDGLLPLHVACTYQAQLDVIKYLVKRNQGAVHAKTMDGKFPVELARENGAPAEVIDFLQEQLEMYLQQQQQQNGRAHPKASGTAKGVESERSLMSSHDDSVEGQSLDTSEHPATTIYGDYYGLAHFFGGSSPSDGSVGV